MKNTFAVLVLASVAVLLVALSACSTSSDKNMREEGLTGLASKPSVHGLSEPGSATIQVCNEGCIDICQDDGYSRTYCEYLCCVSQKTPARKFATPRR